MWLCMWPIAGGIQCPACVHPSDCVWRYTWTGRLLYWPSQFYSNIARYLCLKLMDLTFLFSSYEVNLVVSSSYSFMICVNSSEPEDRSQTQTIFSWLVKTHLFSPCPLPFIFIDLTVTVFSCLQRPSRITPSWFGVCVSTGWLCWPGILQLGDIHIPAGFKSQMAWPHHTFKRKPRKQTNNPSIWLLWWDFHYFTISSPTKCCTNRLHL